MNVVKKKVLKTVSKMTERETKVCLGKVPCIGFLYQPKRPKNCKSN